jgi:hypothetical protein
MHAQLCTLLDSEFSPKLVPPTFHVELVASSLIAVKKPAIGHEVPKMVLVPEKLPLKQNTEGSCLLKLRHCASIVKWVWIHSAIFIFGCHCSIWGMVFPQVSTSLAKM